jgi:HD-GYP domain-containing protein (c-di-GMP phosphodiesterase class II)
MLILSIDNVKENMQLAKNIYSAEGNTLLAAGTYLTDYFVAKLKEFGVSTLYITDKYIGKIEVDELVKIQAKKETTKIAKEVMTKIQKNQALNGEKIHKAVNDVIDDLLQSHNIMYNLVEIRAMNDYHYSHNVTVCILALITGITAGYNYSKLRQLGTGALLHDIGKARIPVKILNKNGNLTTEEYVEVKKHSQIGFDILKQCKDISIESAYIALQHHERFDGSGYPQGLKGSQIEQAAQITTLADVYDAMSTDRIYRKRLFPQMVIEYIRDQANIQFDPELSQLFLANIAPFPTGSLVLLNNGEKGIVIKVPRDFPARPLIKVIFDQYGNLLKNPIDKDLKKDLALLIVNTLKDNEQ